MRPIWKILIVAAVVAGLLAAALIVPHYRAKAAAQAYREQLKAHGEKMTIADLTPGYSADETGNGRELLTAITMLRKLTNYPSMMHWVSPGHAVVGWRETNSITDESTNCWPEMKAAIGKHPEVTAAVREAVKKPFGFALDYQQGYALPLPHLAQTKRASLWLAEAAAVELHEGNTSNAWDDLQAEVELIAQDDSEPFIISQLVRIAMAQIAVAATWEALQYPGWSEEQLARLQQDWDSFDLRDHWEASLSMERAIWPMVVAEMRNSYTNFTSEFGGLPWAGGTAPGYNTFGQILAEPVEGIKAHLRYQAWKSQGSYEEEMFMAQISQAELEAWRHSRTNDAFFSEFNNFHLAVTNIEKAHPGWERRFPLAVAEETTMPNSLPKAADAETARRMTVTAIALERYRRRHGKYPEQLPELVPEFLAKLPIDFMDGKPLRYRRRDDGTFLLYSVGEDGKDDGGDGSVPPNYTYPTKTWYRMRDAVWPMPATVDEVKKYEAEMLSKVKIKPPGKLVPPVIPEPAKTNSGTN